MDYKLEKCLDVLTGFLRFCLFLVYTLFTRLIVQLSRQFHPTPISISPKIDHTSIHICLVCHNNPSLAPSLQRNSAGDALPPLHLECPLMAQTKELEKEEVKAEKTSSFPRKNHGFLLHTRPAPVLFPAHRIPLSSTA